MKAVAFSTKTSAILIITCALVLAGSKAYQWRLETKAWNLTVLGHE